MTLTEPVTTTKAAAPAPLRRKKFTREEIDRLLKTDFFGGQRYELIDGDLIDKMGQDAPHASGIRRTSKWFRTFLPDELVQVQLPIELIGEHRDLSVPEPDISILAEFKKEYDFRHPLSNEILLAVEVSDSRAWYDLGRKAEIYAASGVPEYWVLDLNRRMLVVHRQPDGAQYRLVQLFSEEQTVSMEGHTEAVRVGEILPHREQAS